MSGALLIGVSSIGKTHLVEEIGSPRFMDADEIISSTIGFPQVDGPDQWWDVLSEEELSAFGEAVYEILSMYAKDNWVIGGIGPIPGWVPDLMAQGINVYFITAPRDQIELNVERREYRNPDTIQPIDLEAILSWYVDTQHEMTKANVPSIAYSDIERQFKKWDAARRGRKIVFTSIYTNEANEDIGLFSWNGVPVECNTGTGTVTIYKKGVRHPFPTWHKAKWYQPNSKRFRSIANDCETLWFKVRRVLNRT